MTKTSLSTATPIDTTYSYYDSNRGSGYTTTKLKSETIGGTTYTYQYDTLGNITAIFNGSMSTANLLYMYKYDKLNQLTDVIDYSRDTYTQYTYDSAGNITKSSKYGLNKSANVPDGLIEQINYTYDDENWGDKLTSYDGQTITYDAIGNPLSYRDGMTMTWKNGRQLATLQDSDNTISYEYDSSSIRTSKTVDGVKHTYAYLGGKLMYETRGNAKFYYSYDANGILYSVKYTLTDTSAMQTYFFTHNSRGDIVGIYDSNGIQQAKYEYDAWGNILSVTDSQGISITDQNHIANLNPLRYRGYYYDSETGLYYVSSRYYDPVTGRFISPDTMDILTATPMELTDKNLFSYCDNNPIVRIDICGNFWESIFDVVSLGASIVEVCVNPVDPLAWAALVGDTIDLIPFVTGVGEVTRAVNTTVKVVNKSIRQGTVLCPDDFLHYVRAVLRSITALLKNCL